MIPNYELTATVLSPYDPNRMFTVFLNLEGELIKDQRQIPEGWEEIYEFSFCGPYVPFWERGYDHEFYVHSLRK